MTVDAHQLEAQVETLRSQFGARDEHLRDSKTLLERKDSKIAQLESMLLEPILSNKHP